MILRIPDMILKSINPPWESLDEDHILTDDEKKEFKKKLKDLKAKGGSDFEDLLKEMYGKSNDLKKIKKKRKKHREIVNSLKEAGRKIAHASEKVKEKSEENEKRRKKIINNLLKK